ncbi:hypothetical protein H7H82_12925 [Mycobacterium heidelbergense]|uniref:hypothetical protein n=1 Tax=Mycobacterium heidelbergense TaxID=53376 RepID=UPI0021F2A397|nr:hypothetical protein [Mycobacterium heidelbergense]MCV7051489.1 hypothetical protein [Mycobacterium heidelbergense]
MIGLMIMSSTPAWAGGATIGVMVAVRNAPAAVPKPTTRPRLAFALRRSRLMLCCLRFI